MNYCPYCSAPLQRKQDVCPECNKVIDHKLLGDLYTDNESTKINRSIRRKIWFKEHAIIILPVLTLIAGVIVGAIVMFGYLQIAFQAEREDYTNQIATLNKTIEDNKSSAQSSSEEFQNVIKEKDQIINILSEQMDLMGRAVNFTNRLDRNSTITTTSSQEADFYRRNIIYLNNQFSQQAEALAATEYEPPRSYSLITLPSLVEQTP
jgi:hypothetical protein